LPVAIGHVDVRTGQLVLANFSAANPIKVMAIGDSITDDNTPAPGVSICNRCLIPTVIPSLLWAGTSQCHPGVSPRRTMKGIAEPLLPRPA